MRIAHVITRMILGGAQENVLLSCEDLLREYGDDVLLITGPAVGPEGSLLDRARAGGVPLAIVPSLQRAVHPWRDWKAFRAVGKALRDFRPDVVHTHSAKGGIIGRAVAWRMKVPVIVHTVHGAPFHPYQSAAARSLIRACERWAAKRCHHMVSVCDAMTGLLVTAGVAPREKFTTIHSGVEVGPLLESHRFREAVRGKLGYRPEHVVIGKIARLFHLKGHEYVIEAAKRLVRAAPHVRFLLVGDGLLRDRLEKQIRAAGLASHFQFAGLAPPEDIPGLVAAMDIVVHASLREGLARALVHGQLAGKPVVSFDIDGAREVVIDDITGYLAAPRDCGGLAAALERLSADRALRDRLGGQGRARCAERFCHHRTSRELRALYAALLSIANRGKDC
jgi:glycosyltransferase involved in cell wall biosynthesis